MPRSPAASLLVLLLATTLSACGGAGVGELPGSPSSPPGGQNPPPGDPLPPSSTSMSDAELAMAFDVLAIVNQERQAAGLADLTWHDGAAEVAYQHSVDMQVRDFFDHTNPDGDLPWDRLSDAGIPWSRAGENIAWGYTSPQSVMTGWMNSSGHRANILNGNFTHIGVGVHQGGGSFWTQVFLTPPR